MSLLDAPPLAAWPAFAYEQEPAHGFFQRLAQSNRVFSTRGLATDLGLNGRNPDVGELLEFCLKFPVANAERLVEATPLLSERHVRLAGQTFRRVRDWSLTQPRVCPACISEGPFHRTWFDLNSVSDCPFHGVSLVDGVGDDLLAWWHPTIGEVPSGATVAVAHPRIEPPETWERYLLGRLGFIEPWRILFLDDVELHHIIDAADLLGFASLNGWRSEALFRRRYSAAQRREAVREGFSFLCEGENGIRRCLSTYAEGGTVLAEPGRVNFTIYTYWGWLRDAVRALPVGKCADAIRTTMEAAALERGVASRKPRVPHASVEVFTLYRLAETLGISAHALRTIALKLGLTTKISNKSDCHFFQRTAVDTLRSVLADLVDRADAIKLVGTDDSSFDQHCAAAGIEPLVRMGGRARIHDHFRKADLERLTA